MELTAAMASTNTQLRIAHRLRDRNTWADQLTEEDFGGFGRGNRGVPTVDDDFFEYLDTVLGGQEGL